DNRCYDTIEDLVEDDNCKIVICTSDLYGQYCEEAAKTYPDSVFLHCAGREEGANIGSYFGRMYEIRYLSGIIAGNQTNTGHIGYVAAFPSSAVDRGINAFTLGVRSINPTATVHVSFCNSWTDDTLAEASVNMLIDKCGADVISTHMDSLAVLRKADERGAWMIGCDHDNSELFPDTYLTGCVWKWDSYYKEQIQSVLRGKFRGEWQWLGIESGIMELVDPAKTGNARPGYENALAYAKKQFEEHTADVFYGPINDIDGKLRIAEGESMPDDAMYDDFGWYVEGVKIEARVK
ncbi:MAG: BMP family ABC transporter substrate-binding protein, partial [Ruminiclostridium sp.]|nr:BMP family ABC transporter substrate-binding protein [Ruminiclostridium sp.]